MSNTVPRTAIVIVAALPFVAGCARSDASVNRENTAQKAVRMTVVELPRLSEPTTYSAIIAPNAQVDLAFRVPGYVVYLNRARAGDGRVRPLEAGAEIRAGAVLARIRAPDYQAVEEKARGTRDEAQAGVSAAQAQASEAEAALAQAELDFERVAVLWQQESITKPAYDASKARLDMARAKVDAAKAAITATRERSTSAAGQWREAQLALGDTELRAPLNGVLLERRVEVGTFATTGTPAFVVADLRLVKARFNVPDTALRAFRPGQSLPLAVDAFSGERFDGRILSIAPAADPRARSFEVIVSIENPGMRLRSGMIASIQAVEADASARRRPQIPVDALVHDPVGDNYVVYTAELKGGELTVRAVPIKPGPLVGNQVVVLDGLTTGQRIVVSGANLLRPGDHVKEIQ
jgi:RND family efflux transporter MFP subunit